MTPDHHIHPHDELAAYALDALEPAERAVLETHLAQCAVCRAEVDRHLATLAQLTPSAPPPPHEVWERLAAHLPSPEESSFPASAQVPAPERRPPRHLASARSRWLLPAAAVLVVVVGVGIGAVVWSRSGSDDTTNVAELAAETAADPDAEVVALTTDDGGAVARIVMTDNAADYVIFDKLQPLQDDRAYQLWDTANPQAPVSLGVLGNGEDRAVQLALPTGTSSFALSEEPSGGVPAPTGPIVAHT